MRSGALLPAGLAALAAAVVVLGALLAGVLAPATGPTAAERVEALAGQLRCPDCQSLSVAESRTAAAAAIRSEIEGQVAAGRSDDDVRLYFTDRYGAWILLAPPDPLVWWLPAVAVLAGLIGLAAWFGFGGRLAPPTLAPRSVGEDERNRIHDELEALDG